MARSKNNYLLAAGALLLLLLCILSMSSPIRFERERAEREAAVIQRLTAIRTAEEQYRKQHGTYTGSWDKLVRSGLLDRQMQFIPYADDRRFDLSASSVMGKSGRQIPVMECGACYDTYLHGLDENDIADLIEAANAAARYPGLRIGDTNSPNNNAGSWE